MKSCCENIAVCPSLLLYIIIESLIEPKNQSTFHTRFTQTSSLQPPKIIVSCFLILFLFPHSSDSPNLG